MAEKGGIKGTVDALSRGGLVIRGRVYDVDADSVTIDTGGAHYDVLFEYVINAQEMVAKAKRGETIEVHLLPDAKIVEKRLFDPKRPGITTPGGAFGPRPAGDDPVDESICVVCNECSYCVCDCTECSECRGAWGGGYSQRPGGFVRRRRMRPGS